MALREIVYWPDPVLKRQSEPIRDEEFGPELDALLEDMVETMYDADGLGLAAPQVGLSKQLFVVDVPLGPLQDPSNEGEGDGFGDPPEGGEEGLRTGPLVFINPEFIEKSGKIVYEEGCLSFPELLVEISRAAEVTIRAKNGKGEVFEMSVDGLFAIALQHEYDHLIGHLIVEHLSPLKRQLYKKKAARLKAERET